MSKHMSCKDFPKLGDFVTNPKDFIGGNKTQKETPDGLFSEQIFGPKKNMQCLCGNLNGVIHENETCSTCGVLCTSNSIRSTQFGKIKTIFPFIKPNKRKLIIKSLGKLTNNIVNPNRNDVNLDSQRYLAFKVNRSSIKIVDSLTPIDDYFIIPFRITGIYSLYIALKFCADFLKISKAIEFFKNNYITDIIKVIPPNLRMFSIDSDKDEIRTPAINKEYTSLLNSNAFNLPMLEYIKLDEKDFLDQIKISLKNHIIDQDIFNVQLIEYDTKASGYQRIVNNIYENVYSTLSGKPGLIRNSILGKTIEFSGRTVITVDPSLKAYQIKVSKKMLKKLWMPYFLHYLIEYDELDATYCFDRYMMDELDNEEELDKKFDEFLEWFYDDNEEGN
jgi:DNA-directed RNA polymerase subunit beta'